jgi:hypothetical protein
MGEVGLIITAKDKASAALKAIGSTGRKSLGSLQLSSKKAGDTLKALPEQLGKSSTALLLFQNSVGQMGGKAADAANKLTAVAGLVASGGPIGIGLAAATVAVGAASWAWSEYTEEAERARQAQQDLNEMIRIGAQGLDKIDEAIRAASDELSFMGLTATEAAIQKQAEWTAGLEQGVRELEARRDALQWNGRAFRELTTEEQKSLDVINRRIEAQTALVSKNREQLQTMEELEGSRKIEARKEREAIARQRLREVAIRKRQQAEREAAAEAAALVEETARLREQIQRDEDERLEGFRKRRLEREKAAEAIITELRQRRFDMAVKASNEQAEMEEANQQRRMDMLASQVERQDQMYADLATAAGSAFASMITDSKNAGKHALEGALQVAQTIILARAAEAGAGAGSAVSSIPIIGPALIPAAITAAFAAVRGALALLPSFNEGGMISGPMGRDNLLGRFQAGERTMSREQARTFDRLDRFLGDTGTATNKQTGMTVQIQAPIQNPEEMSQAQIKRWFLRASPAIEELISDGLAFQNLQR